MKLTIERLTILTHQDPIDLAKIWPEQHFPGQLREATWQRWINEGKPLFAARFNDRLLGAVKVVVHGQRAELVDLCVREVTRRRGVGLYLMEETLRQLPEVKHWYLAHEQVSAINRAEMGAFMRACGFSDVTQGWQR
ncbi:putative acetyltransferase [Yersinia aldovae]|uniref:aspartate 1-decarboxylase autocleavage activator PanM n=1 Tax=Yersinia aldovae TaxID=29483 RepID=UPI0005DE73A6|nr:aspartate 1-decarboxylase autocleavage activator PanM [Yersinia aldovae]CNJ92095.1 putative acetyltransferase [Yersinia aldovae]